jgi:membrane protein implicated in regulation of membrane protease activity
MDPSFYWLIGAVLLVLLELYFSQFVLLCFSFAALVACIVTFLGGGLKLQLLFFTVFTVIGFVVVRPFFLKRMKPKGGFVETNVNALIGVKAMVIEQIGPEGNAGRVKIRGEEWCALSKDLALIPVGSTVKILEVSGNKVVVNLHPKGE